MSWMTVWTRAVIVPATKRAVSMWAGVMLGAAIVGGGNGIYPHDVTTIALDVPLAGIALAAIWVLLFVPVARTLIKQPKASYLRSLPGPRVAPIVAAAAAVVVLQAPWIALWIAGAGARGAIVAAGFTLPIVAIAAYPARPARARNPRWSSLPRALASIYLRALVRRAGHALVRGVGLALVAGGVGGLMARNNALAGPAAATIATAAIAIVLIPGWAGALVPLVDVHRESAWIAASLGASERTRIAVLATAVAAVYVVGAAVAAIATAVVAGPSPYFALVVVAAAGISLVTTRALVWADRAAEKTLARAVVGATLASASCVLAIGLLGATGIVAMLAAGGLAIATVRA